MPPRKNAYVTLDYLTREEAAHYADVSLATIDRRLRDGHLPRVWTGIPRRLLIPRAVLDLQMEPAESRRGARTRGRLVGRTARLNVPKPPPVYGPKRPRGRPVRATHVEVAPVAADVHGKESE